MSVMDNQFDRLTIAEQNALLNSGKLLTVRLAHERYGVPKITIYQWIRRGHLSCGRSGRSIYLDPAELERCIAMRPAGREDKN